jgi:hypothetical protein
MTNGRGAKSDASQTNSFDIRQPRLLNTCETNEERCQQVQSFRASPRLIYYTEASHIIIYINVVGYTITFGHLTGATECVKECGGDRG